MDGYLEGKIGDGNEVFLKKRHGCVQKDFYLEIYNFISRCLIVDVDKIVWKNFTFFFVP